MSWRSTPDIFKASPTLHVALLDVAQRENQKHDRRDGKEHYSTRTVGFGSTQP